MWFLFDSHGYFEERADVPFFQGLVAVFLTGGITFLTTITSLLWVSQSSPDTLTNAINAVSLHRFVFTFFSAFVMWTIITLLFYVFILWDGVGRIDLFTVISMTGLGFVPLAFYAFLELSVSVYLTSHATHPATEATTNAVLTGQFGLAPAAGVLLLYTLMILWSGHIWVGAVHQMGRISPTKATAISLVAVGLLFAEKVALALL